MDEYGTNNAYIQSVTGAMQRFVFLLPLIQGHLHMHTTRKIAMVICQTVQCHMAAVSQSLETGSNLTSD